VTAAVAAGGGVAVRVRGTTFSQPPSLRVAALCRRLRGVCPKAFQSKLVLLEHHRKVIPTLLRNFSSVAQTSNNEI
jgi:hypothetical protein